MWVRGCLKHLFYITESMDQALVLLFVVLLTIFILCRVAPPVAVRSLVAVVPFSLHIKECGSVPEGRTLSVYKISWPILKRIGQRDNENKAASYAIIQNTGEDKYIFNLCNYPYRTTRAVRIYQRYVTLFLCI